MDYYDEYLEYIEEPEKVHRIEIMLPFTKKKMKKMKNTKIEEVILDAKRVLTGISAITNHILYSFLGIQAPYTMDEFGVEKTIQGIYTTGIKTEYKAVLTTSKIYDRDHIVRSIFGIFFKIFEK